MVPTRVAIREELERKICLACGHRGRSLQGERGLTTFECPSCGADLYARPPRSYAELEGFVESDWAPVGTTLSLPGQPRLGAAIRKRVTARRARRAEFVLVASIVFCFGLVVVSGLVAGFLI